MSEEVKTYTVTRETHTWYCDFCNKEIKRSHKDDDEYHLDEPDKMLISMTIHLLPQNDFARFYTGSSPYYTICDRCLEKFIKDTKERANKYFKIDPEWEER